MKKKKKSIWDYMPFAKKSNITSTLPGDYEFIWNNKMEDGGKVKKKR